MSEGRSFYGSPQSGGRRDKRVAALAVVLVVAGICVAIAKPWGGPVPPPPPSQPPVADATSPPASLPTAAPEVPGPSASIGPLPVAFTTPLLPAFDTWTGLYWWRLAPDDPLSLVTSVMRWRHGLIARGWIAAPPSTPVWTSADGRQWDPLPFDTSTTFWPGLVVIGLADLGTGLVAITESLQSRVEAGPLAFDPPIIAWTSEDGRTWTPHVLPPEWLASPPGQAPLLAVGPAGLVVASSGQAARFAISSDGSDWGLVPEGWFPARFALSDLVGTATGYVAVGRWMATPTRSEAAALWSADGRRWSATPTLLPTSRSSGSDVGSAAVSLVVAPDGMVAVGGDTAPGASLWWRSVDGQHWEALPAFPPLGPTTCTGEGCGSQPNGALVGDGQRMLAVRGGDNGAAWTSTDGLTWSRLRVTGDAPVEQATQAVLLPGGILVSDGTTTWFGQAQGP